MYCNQENCWITDKIYFSEIGQLHCFDLYDDLNFRKKTTLWHGTVAGTLSSGCPHHFTSGANELGETGWWRLTTMKPPYVKKGQRYKLCPKVKLNPSIKKVLIVSVKTL